MSESAKRSTIYFDPDVHRALKVKAAHASCSVSEVVNAAVKIALAEDHEDLLAFDERSGEKTMSYEDLLKDLKAHGKL
ncbi:MAG: CopG family transcriptional regulator [Deltaproteobacteria bacterium RIFOXYA12_FULL_61_11]|nr:MAG: CopG family transcriptional regulator [Deltaproteobacteria bacterium RIFOXYA12_FULL_61_11]